MAIRRTGSRTASTAPAAGRGITAADVDRAADALLRQGHRPTIERVRLKIGRGSPNTINPLLDEWWSRLAGRLDAGPAALHRLPEPVLHAVEGLWLQALADARRRVNAETGQSKKRLDRERQELTVQSHILSIRESELKARIDAAERRADRLELEVETLTTLLRKEQASRSSAERRLADAQVADKRMKKSRRRTTSSTRGRTRPVRATVRSRKPSPSIRAGSVRRIAKSPTKRPSTAVRPSRKAPRATARTSTTRAARSTRVKKRR